MGRLDDVIVLSTGEKTVPVPSETHIAGHPYVAAAIMFGRRRTQVGLLVEPQPAHAIALGDQAALVAFRNALWYAMSFSRTNALIGV